jgi:hypothetical protein
MEQLTSHWTDFHEIWYLRIFQMSVDKFTLSLKSGKIKMSSLDENQHTFFIISRPILLRMRNVSDKSCRENQNTYFVFSNVFSKIVPFMSWGGKISTSGAVHTWKMWPMSIARWISKATKTHSQNVWYSLLFHCNNGCTNAPQCYFIRTLPVLILNTHACTHTWELKFCRYSVLT